MREFWVNIYHPGRYPINKGIPHASRANADAAWQQYPAAPPKYRVHVILKEPPHG